MEISSILPYLIPILTAVGGWFISSFLKLRQEFGEHRSGFGHKMFVDYTNTEVKDIRKSISRLETLVSVNSSKIDNSLSQIKEVARGSKYRFREHDARVEILEEVMRREGYLIFEKQEKGEIQKDTLDLEDKTEPQ
jgi:hypothetical protein